MPVSETVRKQCRAFLEPGDEIRYLVPGTSLSINAMAIVHRFALMVSDRHITVLSCSRWRRMKPVSVWATHPRRIKLGPVDVHPSLGPTIGFGGLTLEIDEEFVSVIRAADLE